MATIVTNPAINQLLVLRIGQLLKFEQSQSII